MFSVVIPLYNKEHTIVHTLSTVLTQTYPEFELVIVNDGSTDKSVEIIESSFSDSRIRIINQENKGVSTARNEGVRQAKYDYIAFLDGDDEWLPDYLKEMKNSIEKYPDAGMYFTAGYVRDNSGEGTRLPKGFENKTLEIEYFQNPHAFSHASATVVSKTYFNKTDGFPENLRWNEDFAFFYAMALISKVVYCGKPLSVYNGDIAGQATRTKTSEEVRTRLSHIIYRINYTFKLYKESKQKKKYYTVFEKYHLRSRILLFIKKKDYDSLQYFLDNLDQEVRALLNNYEISIYSSKKLNYLAKSYVYLTKMIWKSLRFPKI